MTVRTGGNNTGPSCCRAQWVSRKTLSCYIWNKQLLFTAGEKSEQQSFQGKHSGRWVSGQDASCLPVGSVSFIHGVCFASPSTLASPPFASLRPPPGPSLLSVSKPPFSQHATNGTVSPGCVTRGILCAPLGILRLQDAGAGRALGGCLLRCCSPRLGHPARSPLHWDETRGRKKDFGQRHAQLAVQGHSGKPQTSSRGFFLPFFS